MNNQQLIESLQYHTYKLYEEESNSKKGGLGRVAAIGAGAVGGEIIGNHAGAAIGGAASALKNRKAYADALNHKQAAQKAAATASKTPGLAGKIAQGNAASKGMDATMKMWNFKDKVAKASLKGRIGGAVGGAVAGGMLAKKAYDHFKNKKK